MIVYVLTEPAQPLSLQLILAIVLVAIPAIIISDNLTLPLPIPIRYCINDFTESSIQRTCVRDMSTCVCAPQRHSQHSYTTISATV